MEELKQPSNPATGGGGPVTEETPEQIIEEYLNLVREKLPESIADDVITELRTYMLETASEIGNGELSEDTAKRVVARFGAPGEVADEYRYSMFPESIDDEEPPHQPGERQIAPSAHELELQRDEAAVHEQQQQPKHSASDPVYTYSDALLKILGLVGFWAIITSILSTPSGGNWTTGFAVLILLLQVAITSSYFMVKLILLEKQGVRLWKKEDSSWSRLQSMVSLPEGIAEDRSSLFIAIDIIGSSVGLLIFTFLQIMTSLGQFYLIQVSGPAAIAFAAKIWYAFKSGSRTDPLSFAKRQFVANFVAFAASGTAVSWISFNPTWYRQFNFPGAEVFITCYALLFGPFILYQIITTAQDLWWKTQSVVEPESKEIKDASQGRALDALKSTAFSIILYGAGAIAFMTFMPIIASFYGLVNPHEISWRLVPILVLIMPLILPAVIIYYIYRRVFIQKLGARETVGRRTRPEAVLDFVLSAFLTIVLFTAFTRFLYPNYVQTILFQLMMDYGEFGGTLLLASEIFSLLLIMGALCIRCGANILRGTNSHYEASIRSIAVSNAMLLTALAQIFLLDYIEFSMHFISMNFLVILFFYSVALGLGFQLALSQKQLEALRTPKKPLKSHTRKISTEEWKRNM